VQTTNGKEAGQRRVKTYPVAEQLPAEVSVG
jgi:hypothetical protein